MKRTSITIIGMGPRGLSVFERLAALALHRDDPLLEHFVKRPRIGKANKRQRRHLVVFREDCDRADVEQAIDQRLMEMQIFHVP